MNRFRLLLVLLILPYLGAIFGPVQIDPTKIDFGTVVNNTGKALNLKIIVNVNVDPTVDLIFQFAALVSNPFTLSATEASVSNGLIGKSEFTLQIQLKAGTKAGTYSNNLFIQQLQNNKKTTLATIPVTAVVVDALAANPAALDFGNISLEQPKSLPLKLTSAINGFCTFKSDSKNFSVKPESASLVAGSVTNLTVTFSGAPIGTTKGNLTIRATAAQPLDFVTKIVPLAGAVGTAGSN